MKGMMENKFLCNNGLGVGYVAPEALLLEIGTERGFAGSASLDPMDEEIDDI